MRGLALALALFLIMATASEAQSERRYALVIGNGDYAELGKLRNPANDAQDMARALEELGFSVKLLLDADLPSMEEAVERLGVDLARSPDSVGFFYFAGHGVQSGGTNFLIPADARIVSDTYLKTKALPAQSVLDTLQRAHNALNIVVLDACRDNPFSWARSGSRGLTIVGNQPPGSIVAYATSAGSVAQDGTGRNGVFTAELLRQIRAPGLEIAEVFKRTGKGVSVATGGKQVPAIYNQFFDEAYLAGSSVREGTSALSQPAPENYAPGPALQTGELVVSANREGAEIWVNGSLVGTAPNLFSGIPASREVLVEAKQGLYSASQRLSLEPGETREISFALELGKGNLFFQVTSPSSYRLWLDGREWGGLSAAGLAKDVEVGEREAELRGAGMYWRDRITVRAGATTQVKAAPWEIGTITVEIPDDASFRLAPVSPSDSKADRALRSGRGRQRCELLPSGTYLLEAWGPGYEGYKETISLAKGEDKRFRPWDSGSLIVSSTPPGASVQLSGGYRGTTPLRLQGLNPGFVTLTIQLEGYDEISQEKMIEVGKTTEAVYLLTQKAPKPLPQASAPSLPLSLKGSPRQVFVTLGTGGTAGTYFPLGTAIAEILNKTIPKMNANATATGASAANVALLKEGKADIIFVQNDAAYYALNDLEFFKGKAMKEIRGIACLYKETIQLVALSSSGIRSLSDLKGKRVSVGAAGSGVEINARHILSAAGLAYNDIRVHYLSFAEASANLKEGKIDAAFNTAGVPTAAIQDLAASTRITLVPIEGSAASALKAKYPFYVADRIPAGAYTGQSGDVSTVAAKSMLAVNANIDANLVYNFLVAIFSNRDRLAAAHARGADIKLATALEGMSIPLHPGAEMFYRDAR